MALKALELEGLKNGKGILAKAAADEPLFILRANDKFMPDLLELWIAKVQEAAQTPTQGEAHDVVRKRSRKIEEARALLRQVRTWQGINGCKVPD